MSRHTLHDKGGASMGALDLTAPRPEKLLWNVGEAGAALSISPWTVRLYIRQRKLRPVRVGRRVLLEPDECRRFLDTCKRIRLQKGEVAKDPAKGRVIDPQSAAWANTR